MGGGREGGTEGRGERRALAVEEEGGGGGGGVCLSSLFSSLPLSLSRQERVKLLLPCHAYTHTHSFLSFFHPPTPDVATNKKTLLLSWVGGRREMTEKELSCCCCCCFCWWWWWRVESYSQHLGSEGSFAGLCADTSDPIQERRGREGRREKKKET